MGKRPCERAVPAPGRMTKRLEDYKKGDIIKYYAYRYDSGDGEEEDAVWYEYRPDRYSEPGVQWWVTPMEEFDSDYKHRYTFEVDQEVNEFGEVCP